jgi:hypothetical protein
MKKFLLATLVFLTFSCASDPQQIVSDTPSWYISPAANNSENLYGVAEGYTLEEATKYALADAASRLMVTISSDSSLLREENKNGVNEEMRQRVRQNVEKINFTNFSVSKSAKFKEKFYVEVEIKRDPFIAEQNQQLGFLEKQVSDLEKNSIGKNTIQKRNSLIKILDLEKEIELKARIVYGAGVKINLTEKLNRVAYFRDQLNSLSDNVEFYLSGNSSPEISKVIRNFLNRDKLKVSPTIDRSNNHQVVVAIKSKTKANKIYGSYMVKLEINFENSSASKIIASNSVEVSGSSAISEEEAFSAAIASLREEIEDKGVLKIIGILN